jgi:hypothetical protein
MNNKTATTISSLAAIIAICSLIFSIGYYKAKIDQLIERTDPKIEQLRIESIVDKAVDQKLKIFIKNNQYENNTSETVISTTQVNPSHSIQELPTIIFEIEEPKENENIPNGIIKVSGTHTMPLQSHVWILLGDSFGNYYLQNPPVILRRNGTWKATNIRPGMGITSINAVYVDTIGNKTFEEKVRNNNWAGFAQLPESARILNTINFIVTNQ